MPKVAPVVFVSSTKEDLEAYRVAARGVESRKYPWGEKEPTPELANYDETKVGGPTPVGLFPRGATPERIQGVWEIIPRYFLLFP